MANSVEKRWIFVTTLKIHIYRPRNIPIQKNGVNR